MNPPYDKSSTQNSIGVPSIHSCNTSTPSGGEPAIQERKMSDSGQIDDDTPPLYNDTTLQDTTNSSFASEDEKVTYNGPSTVHVVMLRVSNERSARPMPQAAFFDHNKALAFSTRILLQWCDAHYSDYIWKGPESLRSGLMERYAAYHAQSGQQLAVADVIKVSIFDTKETEAVVNGEEGSEEHREEEENEQQHKEQFGEGPHEKYSEERLNEDQDDTRTVTTHSAQTEGQEVDSGELRDEPTEVLPTIYSMQAAAAYAMDLATRRAAHNENENMDNDKHRGAWREDYEMKVFGGPTE